MIIQARIPMNERGYLYHSEKDHGSYVNATQKSEGLS